MGIFVILDSIGLRGRRQGLTENFFYDNLYGSTIQSSTTNLDLSYDNLGNILTKSDVGTYSYHATKKHQLMGVTGGYTFTYDDNGNATSAYSV